ncbi:hypothetical protein [Mycolicibacterium brisbanense]|uniref:hypothetical protein n=1 Tax=Mycolicibacterium brisbanense TaxID=146020 RepID=UPI000AA9F07B|nr:hypothetical protein [Mycolicibacterium brisbanense]MCV7158473.1 hypothetical protein [Mycolicibacterium brisbanense]
MSPVDSPVQFVALFTTTFLVSVVTVGAVLDLRYVPQHRPDVTPPGEASANPRT